ncbi:MAG: tyrosine-type recombinase/integrase [Nitrosomonas sp.]|uniref:tyrosine-type recombinase/integrase n=1 Tax=Nitrosomonas sp. TaxID=42353 RepID=UPI002733E7B6|nr:tyrosine-type recombinase/integrase [Nitrosomonas sp.]MDP3279810.1 tyrosine-type recombinase/integrase [Nitrosomonas sp.]MDP3662928.1 tyrosine-type recombinase/integrase [Nitrosomonas sp.]MDZ4105673.1 tyrosine-type recombinase/integrase [Nitrosomonas sp.]
MLTDVAARNAKFSDKPYEARELLAKDIDPSLAKAINKQIVRTAAENTFKAVALEWHAKTSKTWAETTATNIKRYLEKDIFPWLGNRVIRDIAAPELLAVLRKIESRGAHEKAQRCREYAGRVFRYAIATGRAERDPSGDLRGALTPVKVKHHASITDPKAIGALLRSISGFSGSYITKCALQLAPLVFVRPGELRHAEWVEIDFDKPEWRIPGHKMKMKEPHIIPLSVQAVEILQSIHPLTGDGQYVFPSIRSGARPMSENTINAALRRMGYEKDEMTGHGFRSMVSTLLHEHGWPHEAIERQLAHAERNKVVAAYNYAEHLPKRKEMMRWWADYLDELVAGAKVVNFQKT